MIQMRSKRIIDEYHGFSFSRSSMAQDQKGKLYYPNNARFLPGKFGQAVLVEEGTANLWSKGNPETWEGYSIAGNPDQYSAQIVEFQGRTCLKMHIVSAGDGTQDWRGCYISHLFTAVTGDTYTQQCEIYVEPGGRHQGTISKPQLSGENTLSGVGTNYDLNQVGTWQKLIRNSTANADGKGYLNIYLFTASAGAVYDADYTVYLYHPQIEKLPYPTTFVNGTRAAETLTIPTEGVLNAEEGTIEFWVKNIANMYEIALLFDWRLANGTAGFIIGISGSKLYFQVGQHILWGAGKATYGTDWRCIACKWSSEKISLSIDGIIIAFIDSPTLPTGLNPIVGIGGHSSSGIRQCNTLIDDLRISNIARSDEGILAAYESNQPLPVDQYTTCKLGFDGPDGQRGAAIVTL